MHPTGGQIAFRTRGLWILSNICVGHCSEHQRSVWGINIITMLCAKTDAAPTKPVCKMQTPFSGSAPGPLIDL